MHFMQIQLYIVEQNLQLCEIEQLVSAFSSGCFEKFSTAQFPG